jgi:hypothetical protein
MMFGSNQRGVLAGGLLGSGIGQTEGRKRAAWAKTRPPGLAAALLGNYEDFRTDDFGHLIRWQDYGKYNSPYGWEIDHQHPSALGGSDGYANLRALHCKRNRSLGGLLGSALSNS